jgi:hypothetical protein
MKHEGRFSMNDNRSVIYHLHCMITLQYIEQRISINRANTSNSHSSFTISKNNNQMAIMNT